MNLGDIVPAVYVLGMVGVVGGVMLTVMDSLALDGSAAQFIGNATEGLTNLSAQLGLVGTVVALAVVLGVVMLGFGGFAGIGGRSA